jgi:hypothetical protein
MLEQIILMMPAVVDKNIITTAHYKDMGAWMREVIKKIK